LSDVEWVNINIGGVTMPKILKALKSGELLRADRLLTEEELRKSLVEMLGGILNFGQVGAIVRVIHQAQQSKLKGSL